MSYLRISVAALLAMAILPLSHAGAVTTGPTPGIASTAEAASPTAGRSPFLGAWELDLTRMPETYGSPPKKVVYRFEDVGAGQWLTTIDITAPDGSVRHMAVRYRRDGRASAAEGELSEGDSAAINSPATNVLVMNIAKDKRPASVRVYAISADGNEMTESAADIDDTGTPFVRNFHYKRIG